jgi:hypothetical protein
MGKTLGMPDAKSGSDTKPVLRETVFTFRCSSFWSGQVGQGAVRHFGKFDKKLFDESENVVKQQTGYSKCYIDNIVATNDVE